MAVIVQSKLEIDFNVLVPWWQNGKRTIGSQSKTSTCTAVGSHHQSQTLDRRKVLIGSTNHKCTDPFRSEIGFFLDIIGNITIKLFLAFWRTVKGSIEH